MWSPDGYRIAFEQTDLHNRMDLVVAETRIGGPVQGEPIRAPFLTGPFGGATIAVSPTWHPSGIVVFELASASGNFRLFYTRPPTRAASEMIRDDEVAGDLTFPAIAPDGSATAFISDSHGNGDLWIRSTDTGQSRPLLETHIPELFPAWSRDSRTLYFVSDGDDGHDISSFDPEDGEHHTIIGGPGDQTRPTAIADGVAFFESAGEDWKLRAKVGEQIRTLAEAIRLPLRAGPAVSPDGSWVATTHEGARGNRVFLHHIDGSETLEIDTPHIAVGEPALAERAGQTLLAYTGLDAADGVARQLYVMDITDALEGHARDPR